MQIEFDPKKDAANRLKHGISLEAATVMDLASATIIEDRRFDYGETRLLAYASDRGSTLRPLLHPQRRLGQADRLEEGEFSRKASL